MFAPWVPKVGISLMISAASMLDHLSQVGPHQKEIENHFQHGTHWSGDGPIFPHPLIVLAFTNRSGSNFLAEMLKSTRKIAGLGEALNSDTVIERAQRWNLETFPDYFRVLSERTRSPFGVKASWDQLLMLLRFNIPAMYTGLRVIHIHRHDVVSQGISLQIAWQTGKWTSLTPVHETVVPTYDPDSITQQITSTQLAEAVFPLIFEAFSIEAHHVSYEDATRAPEKTVRDAMEAIGFPVPKWRFVEPALKKQADAINDDFRMKYKAVLKQYCLSAPRQDD